MTVGIAVKVFDGIVLATDSATTLDLGPGGGHQVYNSANKIFQLHRRLPIGAMTWGLGNVADASISTIAKDLRRRFMGLDPDRIDWTLGNSFTIEQVAERLVDHVFDELYSQTFAGEKVAPILGFLIAGYSARSMQAEAWVVQMDDPNTRPPLEIAAGQGESGWLAYAQPQAAVRLLKGFDPHLLDVLSPHLGSSELATVESTLRSGVLEAPVVIPAMPFADAIGFAKYLVDVTVGYRRFVLGPDTVGGPVEIAGISRHEGFKWVSRKHYYPPELNPKELDHDR